MVLKNEKLLTADEVCEITTLSRQTLWRHTRAGKFPAPVKFGDRLVRWRASDIERFLEARGDVGEMKRGRKRASKSAK